MKTKFLKLPTIILLALILCFGIMLVSFSFSKKTELATTSFSVSLTPGDDLYDFADGLITSWFNDCLRYVNKDDPTYEELETEYENIKNDLNTQADLDDLNKMLIFITSSYNRLDKIYYSWECSAYSEELEEAYKALKDSGAYSGNSEKINKTYNTVLDLISAFEEELNHEDLDNTDRSLINIRVGKSSEIETALEEAIAEFDEIKFEWKQTQTFILWVSISGGILLLAAIIVITLLLIMRKRNIKYKATLVSFKDFQKVFDNEKENKRNIIDK